MSSLARHGLLPDEAGLEICGRLTHCGRYFIRVNHIVADVVLVGQRSIGIFIIRFNLLRLISRSHRCVLRVWCDLFLALAGERIDCLLLGDRELELVDLALGPSIGLQAMLGPQHGDLSHIWSI